MTDTAERHDSGTNKGLLDDPVVLNELKRAIHTEVRPRPEPQPLSEPEGESIRDPVTYGSTSAGLDRIAGDLFDGMLLGRSDWSATQRIELAGQCLKSGENLRRQHGYTPAKKCYEDAKSWLALPVGMELSDEEARTWRTLRAWVQTELVATAHHLGSINEAINEATAGLQWMQDFDHLRPQRVRLLAWLAELYDLRGQAEEAMASVKAAQDLLEEEMWPDPMPNRFRSRQFLLTRPFLQATILRMRGTLHLRSGEWPAAHADFEESLRVAQAAADEYPDIFFTVAAYVERDLCRLSIREGDARRALMHNERSFAIRTSTSLKHGARAVAHRHALIADIYQSMSDKVDEPLPDRIFDAIEAFEAVGDLSHLARSQLRLARLYRQEDRPRDAEYWARRSLAFWVKADLPFDQALAHRQLGMALDVRSWAADEPRERAWLQNESEKYLRASVDSLTSLHDRFELAVSQRALARFLARRASSLPDHSESLQEIHELLEAAKTTFASLGAKLELEKTLRLLQWLSMKEGSTLQETPHQKTGVD